MLIVTFQSDPLFNSTGMMPGDSVTRYFQVTNTIDNNPESVKIHAINFSNTPPSPALAGVLYIVIGENGGSLKYGGGSPTGPKTLTQFYAESDVDLGTINPGANKQFDIQITFDPNAGNEYQLTQTQFDLVVGHSFVTPAGCTTTNFNGTVFLGTTGDDDIEGTSRNDLMIGLEGNDHFDTGGGDDCLFGGPGVDNLESGSGNDYIEGGEGNDRIRTGSGNDVAYGGAGDDDMIDSSGIDQIYGEAGDDVVEAGDSNDLVSGGEGNDTLDGGSGNDNISGGPGNDTMTGGSGGDTLIGDGDTDSAEGESGTDTCDAETEITCEL